MDIAENENKPGLPKYTCSDRVPDKYKVCFQRDKKQTTKLLKIDL